VSKKRLGTADLFHLVKLDLYSRAVGSVYSFEYSIIIQVETVVSQVLSSTNLFSNFENPINTKLSKPKQPVEK